MGRPDSSQLLTIAREIVELARAGLTPAQIASVEQDIGAGELLLAIEFVADFLTENDVALTRAQFERLEGALRSMGSERVEMPYLESLIREGQAPG